MIHSNAEKKKLILGEGICAKPLILSRNCMFVPHPPPLGKISSLSSIAHSRKQTFSRKVFSLFPEQAILIQKILAKSKSSIRNYIILKIYFMLKTILCTCCEHYRISSTNSLKQFSLFSYNLF